MQRKRSSQTLNSAKNKRAYVPHNHTTRKRGAQCLISKLSVFLPLLSVTAATLHLFFFLLGECVQGRRIKQVETPSIFHRSAFQTSTVTIVSGPNFKMCVLWHFRVPNQNKHTSTCPVIDPIWELVAPLNFVISTMLKYSPQWKPAFFFRARSTKSLRSDLRLRRLKCLDHIVHTICSIWSMQNSCFNPPCLEQKLKSKNKNKNCENNWIGKQFECWALPWLI